MPDIDTGAQLEEANVRPGEQRSLSNDLGKLPGILGLIGPYLPALGVGLGAALTSPVRSAPAIAGRALLGAQAGYSSSQPPPVTERDRYYQERLAYTQKQRQSLEQSMANQQEWLKSLPEDQRAYALIDPKEYVHTQLAKADRGPNEALLSKAFGIDPEKLKGLDAKSLSKLTADMIHHDAVNKDRPGSYSAVELVKPGETDPSIVILDHHTGKIVSTIGKAPPKAGGKMTEGQAQAAYDRLMASYRKEKMGDITGKFPAFDDYVKEWGLNAADLREKAGMNPKTEPTGKPSGKPTDTARLAPGTVVKAPDGSLHRSVDPNATLPPGYTIEK